MLTVRGEPARKAYAERAQPTISEKSSIHIIMLCGPSITNPMMCPIAIKPNVNIDEIRPRRWTSIGPAN